MGVTVVVRHDDLEPEVEVVPVHMGRRERSGRVRSLVLLCHRGHRYLTVPPVHRGGMRVQPSRVVEADDYREHFALVDIGWRHGLYQDDVYRGCHVVAHETRAGGLPVLQVPDLEHDLRERRPVLARRIVSRLS